MKFDVFRKLGEKKLATIINRLVSGESTMTVARIIQEDWGEAQHLSLGALEKELTKLRLSIDRGGLGSDLAEPPLSTNTDDLKPLHEFVNLLVFQKKRIDELSKRERQLGKPLPAFTTVVKDYKDLLLMLQRTRFDLGLDVYKRVKTTKEWQEAQEARERRKHDQVIEGIGVVEEILKKRGIGLPGTEDQD